MHLSLLETIAAEIALTVAGFSALHFPRSRQARALARQKADEALQVALDKAREEHNVRVREHLGDHLYIYRTQISTAIRPFTQNTIAARSAVDREESRFQELRPSSVLGTAFGIRLFFAVLFVIIVATSSVLNVQVFAALADGNLNVTSIAKGLAVTCIELISTLVIGWDLIHRRESGDTWKLNGAFACAVLVITMTLVASYAPERSNFAFQSQLQTEQNALQSAKLISNPTARSIATSNEKNAIKQLIASRARAQNSDVAQSILLPLGELVSSGMAIEGMDLILLSRRRRQRANLLANAQDHLRECEEVETRQKLALHSQVVADLLAIGVTDIERAVSATPEDATNLQSFNSWPTPTPSDPSTPTPDAAEQVNDNLRIDQVRPSGIVFSEEPTKTPPPRQSGARLNLDAILPQTPTPTDGAWNI